MVTEKVKPTKEEILAKMDSAAEGAGEMVQAWAEQHPEAAKDLGVLFRTFVPTCGYTRLGRIIREL